MTSSSLLEINDINWRRCFHPKIPPFFYFCRHLAMDPRGFLLIALSQHLVSAFSANVMHDRALVGYVFQAIYGKDWLGCIRACHEEPQCVSYNYEEKPALATSVCQLNGCELKSGCKREECLIYSPGVVFQWLRETNVSIVAATNPLTSC